jgi:hypothetical protein
MITAEQVRKEAKSRNSACRQQLETDFEADLKLIAKCIERTIEYTLATDFDYYFNYHLFNKDRKLLIEHLRCKGYHIKDFKSYINIRWDNV